MVRWEIDSFEMCKGTEKKPDNKTKQPQQQQQHQLHRSNTSARQSSNIMRYSYTDIATADEETMKVYHFRKFDENEIKIVSTQ